MWSKKQEQAKPGSAGTTPNLHRERGVHTPDRRMIKLDMIKERRSGSDRRTKPR